MQQSKYDTLLENCQLSPSPYITIKCHRSITGVQEIQQIIVEKHLSRILQHDFENNYIMQHILVGIKINAFR
jgi:hypothetical protein